MRRGAVYITSAICEAGYLRRVLRAIRKIGLRLSMSGNQIALVLTAFHMFGLRLTRLGNQQWNLFQMGQRRRIMVIPVVRVWWDP